LRQSAPEQFPKGIRLAKTRALHYPAPGDRLVSEPKEGSTMTTAKTRPVYHRLQVVADPKTTIWLVDDCWHPVQKAVGTLDTSVLHGRYFVELGSTGLNGVAYPIELFSDLRLTQDLLEAGPACQRQPPQLLDD
jgi:hypothetical protein